jgi:hypothetical protein
MHNSILIIARRFVISVSLLILGVTWVASTGASEPATPQTAADLALVDSLMAETGTPLLKDLKDAVARLSTSNARLIITLDQLAHGPVTATVDLADGKWQRGTASAPQFNRSTHVADASNIVITDTSIRGRISITLIPDAWVPKDKQPRHIEASLDLQYTKASDREWTVTGSWTGKPIAEAHNVSDTPATGKVSGKAEPPAGLLAFNTSTWADGLQFKFDLGAARVNWNRFDAAVMRFPEPRNWKNVRGLRLAVRSPKPRTDAAITAWLMEEDGSWYYVKDAVPLADTDNRAIVHFTDFVSAEWVCPGSHVDENHELDLDKISALAVGVVNPFGIGTVDAIVTELATVGTATPSAPVEVNVTGRTMSVNNHAFIPTGVFGGYADYLPGKFRPGCQRRLHTLPGGGPVAPQDGETFIIDCWGDRLQPPTFLSQQDKWVESLTAAAKNYADACRNNPGKNVLEFWNEPYLDWAKGRLAMREHFFDASTAKENGPVTTRSGVTIPHYVWKPTGGLTVYNETTRAFLTPKDVPANAKAGDTFTRSIKVKKEGKESEVEETLRVVPALQVQDETKFTYWSGKGIGFIYNEMAKVVAKTVHETNPDVPVIVGWGFRWNEDHWAAWDMLYKPTIDLTAAWINGLHEHHYQGDTTAVIGSYEVATAYGMTKHKRWLYSYNTETGDILDFPSRGKFEDAQLRTNAKDYRRLVYVFRDCLYAVMETPDKLMARTEIHTGGRWTDIAFGMLADLRGRLVQCETGDTRVWAVASIDGTDPSAMPADGKPKLVVFVFNDTSDPRTVNLKITPPTQTKWRGNTATVETINLDPDSLAFDMSRAEKPLAAAQVFTHSITLPPHLPVKITLPLDGDPVATAELHRRQFFADDILKKIGHKTEWKTAINLDPAALKQAGRAWLRLVVEGVADGEAICRVGAQSLVIPRAKTQDNANRLLMIPIDINLLAPTTSIAFSTAAGNHDGYQVDMASIVLELDGASK